MSPRFTLPLEMIELRPGDAIVRIRGFPPAPGLVFERDVALDLIRSVNAHETLVHTLEAIRDVRDAIAEGSYWPTDFYTMARALHGVPGPKKDQAFDAWAADVAEAALAAVK